MTSYTWPCPWCWQASILLERDDATFCSCPTRSFHFFSLSNLKRVKGGSRAAPGGNPPVRKYTHRDNGAKIWGENWAFWQDFPSHFGPLWSHLIRGHTRFGVVFQGWMILRGWAGVGVPENSSSAARYSCPPSESSSKSLLHAAYRVSWVKKKVSERVSVFVLDSAHFYKCQNVRTTGWKYMPPLILHCMHACMRRCQLDQTGHLAMMTLEGDLASRAQL